MADEPPVAPAAPAAPDVPHHHHHGQHPHPEPHHHHHDGDKGHHHSHHPGSHELGSDTPTADGVTYHKMPDGRVLHSHDGLKPHAHDPIPEPGSFANRRKPMKRTYEERAFTIGIGGPVGTGKTALLLALCKAFREEYNIAAVTNDIFTKEDGEFLTRHNALPAERIRAVETGGCPHAAIREDISINLTELENLTAAFAPDFLMIESGGDNLAANFSRELADFIIYVIDVCGGDKIPRKGGPGITQADLLVINKTELSEAVGADLNVMGRDAGRMREGGPFVFAQVKNGVGVPDIVKHILLAWEGATGGRQSPSKRTRTQ